jgi:hypothetical protein
VKELLSYWSEEEKNTTQLHRSQYFSGEKCEHLSRDKVIPLPKVDLALRGKLELHTSSNLQLDKFRKEFHRKQD